jgi:hypothetical protein
MKLRRQAVLLVPALLVTMLQAASVESQSQPDQRVLVQQLLRGNAGERSAALWNAIVLGPEKAGPELRAALIALLEANNKIVEEARRRGVATATLENPEFIAHVAHAVSQLQDPLAIPALTRALDSGSTLVSDALAEFGDEAAPAVLAVVTSRGSRHDAVDLGLVTLRFMVEEIRTHPLAAGTVNQIRRAAQQRLTGKQYFTTLWSAIDLAAALGDAELRELLEVLASDPNEVFARGVEDPDLIQRTKKRAADRLAGVPMPRYRSPVERRQLLVGPR